MPLVINKVNITTAAYDSLVIANNNTAKILIIKDIRVVKALYLLVFRFLIINLVIPTIANEINVIQYNNLLRDVI